jgi:hypothetical protein
VRSALAILLATAATALGGAAAPVRAAGLEIGMEDERLLLSDPARAPQAVAAWRALGVDVVRIHAHWWEIAPAGSAARKPAGFRASDPADRRYRWGRLDFAVAIVRAAGMRVMLTVTGPGPLWASRSPRLRNPRWWPRATDFGAFARAVAARYGAQVDRYLIWNEPNQPGWLQPQSTCGRRRVCTPIAPHVYRGLVRAAVPAIHAADPGSEVLLGELAPIGNPAISDKTPIAPLPFLRAMACVDRAYRTVRGGRCAGFRPARADAVGYHPHPLLNAPDQRNQDPDEAQFADLGRLFTVLDRLRARRRLLAGDAVHLTEFGYQTSPPDRAAGIALGLQSRYLQQAGFIAWRAPRLRSLSFYEWEDEPVISRGPGTLAYSGWQSGLRFVTGKPKPALSTFAAPFVIDRPPGRSSALAWGQVRPDAERAVTLLIRPRGLTKFRELAQVTTAADGGWARRIAVTPGAAYRYRWTPAPTLADPAPAPRLSGIVDLARNERSPLRAAAAQAQ